MNTKRPWFDLLRSRLGYQFPRLGPLFFKLFYSAVRKHCSVELFPGILIETNFDDLTHQATYWQGKRFEYPTAQVLCEWAADPRCHAFFDVGANYGFFSYLILSHFPAQVHAFDPNPVNHSQLTTAKATNGLSNLHPHRLGLSDEDGVRQLHLGDRDQGHSTFLSHPGLAKTAVSESSIVRFDDWVDQQTELTPLPDTPCWIAKIDVEGYELKVLRGMENSLKKRRFLGLAVELNEYTLGLSGTSPKEIHDLMAHCGYKNYKETLAGRRLPLHRAPNDFFVPST
ncbi:MAG: FkbM family methyltransferase [bacterium]